jgi:hypothetical protein
MKLPIWFKWERTGYWIMQAASAAVVGWLTYAAIFTDETRTHIIVDAALAGVNLANIFHTWLHRRRDHNARNMIKVMHDQQALLREIAAMKSHEIAHLVAAQMGGEIVSIEGPDGPVSIVPPTKH